MARGDIRQPNSRIFSPSPRRVASAPTQETPASGTTLQQDVSSMIGSANQMAGQYARTKVQEQKEIDIADKHQYIRNKAKYVPEIKKQITENNLEGAPAEEVMAHVRESEEYKQLFSGYKDTDNAERYQKDFLASMEGQALEWQATYEEQQRGRRFVEATTSGLASADPEERPALIQEFYKDAVDPDGPYKQRPEEVQQVLVGLAQQYNQAEQYEMAETVLSNIEFDEGFQSEAGIQLKAATNGIEEVRLDKARAKYKDVTYGLHNDPNTTTDQARETVNMMDEEGLFQSAQQKEATYDWIMGGQQKAQGRGSLIQMLEDNPPSNRQELEFRIKRGSQLYGISDKDADMAREQWVEFQHGKAKQRLFRLQDKANEDGTFDDPELQQEYEIAQDKYLKTLQYAPMDAKSDLIELATLAKNPDGEFSRDQIKALGGQMDEIVQATGGNLYNALETYFPGDENREVRANLVSMSLLRDAHGSWEQGYKQAVETRQAGPSRKHTSWEDEETFNSMIKQYEDAYGNEYMDEFKTVLNTLKTTGAPMNAAFGAARDMVDSDQTAIIESTYFGSEFKLKGKNGRVFKAQFEDAIVNDEEFGPWKEGKYGTRENQPFEVMSDYLEVQRGKWERVLGEKYPGMSFDLNDPEDVFTEEGSIQVMSHPTIPGSLQVKHRNGIVLAPQVRPEDILNTLKDLPDDNDVRDQGPYTKNNQRRSPY